MIAYDLPFPPTTNHLFVQVGGKRIKTREYKAWRQEAGWEIVRQGRMAIYGEVSILIEAVRPDKRRRDIDNLIKAVLDLFTEMRLIEDDSMVAKVSAEWVSQGPDCRVQIESWKP